MTYDKLKQDILLYSQDESEELEAGLDTIIANSEEAIYHCLPNLECFKRVEHTGFLYTDEDTALLGLDFPTGMDIVISITLSTSPNTSLQQRTESYVKELYGNELYKTSGTDTPTHYFTRNNKIIFAPIVNRQNYGVDIEGIGPLPRLSEGNPTNQISENAYNLLLSGCMVEVAKILRMDPTVYAAMFATEKERLQVQAVGNAINNKSYF